LDYAFSELGAKIMGHFLVVGAGFAGAVYARTLADAGYNVTVIDKRDHIGGNAYDYVDENGVRVHRYGPHLFHTNNEGVVTWLQRFTDWLPYEHRVKALLPDGRPVPLPINRDTINAVFGKTLEDDRQTEAFLISCAENVAEPKNAGDYLKSKIGTRLTDLFFRPYTKKMWNLDLEDLSPSVVKRIPLRTDLDDRYFPNDRFQCLPAKGYTAVFESILSHPNIHLKLSTVFTHEMESSFDHCFNSMPIDEYFDFALGELPYRSIRFHAQTRDAATIPAWGVSNYTDMGPFTRETYWQSLPGHRVSPGLLTTVTVEEPCDYRENGHERYYPVKTADDRYGLVYKKYQELAREKNEVTFIGRCGTYQYLDMDQVINQSLHGVNVFLSAYTKATSDSLA
jgi:UDP-galactopyranose mutase